MGKKILFFAFLLSAFSCSYYDASAIPAFARQTGKSCLACHSPAVPHLKFEGRKFKILGYDEINPDYELLPDVEILKKISPFAVRAQFSPVDWENSRPGWSVAPEYELSFYGGARISSRGGVFAQITMSSDMQMAMVHQLKMTYRIADIKQGKAYWSVAGGIGPPTSFDIYMSINPMMRITSENPYLFPHGHMPGMDMGMDMAIDSATCAGLEHGHGAIPEFFQIASPGNMGVVTNLWVGEKLWINTGVFKGTSGNDPDFWGRIAFEPVKTILAIGAFTYIGKEDVSMDAMTEMMCEEMEGMWSMPMMDMNMDMDMKIDVFRAGIDFEFEKTVNMNFIKIMGAYSYIKDEKDVMKMDMVMENSVMTMESTIERETDIFHGFYIQGMYLNQGKFGPVAQFDYLDNNLRGLLGLKYYIFPNVNLNAEFVLNLDDMEDMKFGLKFDAVF